MKLKAACGIAEACGLDTVGEAVFNIKLHAPSLFAYDEVPGELKELDEDAAGIPSETAIGVILKRKN